MDAAANHDPEAETRALAYALWEQAGRPDGQEAMFWDLAEAQLREPEAPSAMPDGVATP